MIKNKNSAIPFLPTDCPLCFNFYIQFVLSREMGDENPDLFKKLPDGFRQKFTREILSRTSPADVMRLSLVSRSFRASANSDVVWDTFIPPDHRRLALQGLRNYTFDSSKRLFRYLCGTRVVFLFIYLSMI